MASKDFEVQQILKAYRKGVVSAELFKQQMDEMCSSRNGSDASKTSRPAGLRGVTGDAGLDAPGGMAKLMQKGKI